MKLVAKFFSIQVRDRCHFKSDISFEENPYMTPRQDMHAKLTDCAVAVRTLARRLINLNKKFPIFTPNDSEIHMAINTQNLVSLNCSNAMFNFDTESRLEKK